MREDCTHMDQSDAGALETLDDLGLRRIWKGGVSDESEGRVTGLGAGGDNEFSDVSGAADDEDLVGHSKLPRLIAGENCGIAETTKRSVARKRMSTNARDSFMRTPYIQEYARSVITEVTSLGENLRCGYYVIFSNPLGHISRENEWASTNGQGLFLAHSLYRGICETCNYRSNLTLEWKSPLWLLRDFFLNFNILLGHISLRLAWKRISTNGQVLFLAHSLTSSLSENNKFLE